jgi:abhydrolase domain-containing protein 13
MKLSREWLSLNPRASIQFSNNIVRASHMKQLFDICEAEIKIWKEFPDGSHNDTIAEEGYFEILEDFINTHVIAEEKPT